ncbi:MAG: hypothetical protein A2087_11665 [Spirochaetes bacterium GWD1_61_31]|nr:MAG: hypothetical protein A2Y37_14895 [Spirochaetes bacterium GWB1_60_80]OHD30311.1 MAG: hypothetical protein A2004_02830 [Spirochaetes bacterium GWC1_61_12]OHD35857.1 MAG: hypothetical protein A2087_11665 [Spirochaetes bacterium GWD1_61_31]OHD46799.1 MAG: hypothetical protein A2Y35_10835 [Spirochaetes bacterium GWE1_60_18]OHD61251.1 MAG: hypothetical protein A2Y32_13130 [Spirochaetes bacterium GWF1_60_12]
MAEHSPRVLVADDEPGIRDALVYALEAAGFRVKACPDGLAAWEAFAGGAFDLAILDIMMPRLDGLELLKRMRAAGAELPVLLLTSRDEEFDRVLGLELGADDYLCKPFSLRELVARLRALLRRAVATRRLATAVSQPDVAGSVASVLAQPTAPAQPGGLNLDADCLLASWRGSSLHFTVSEFRILAAMAARPGVVFDRDMLLAAAYPDERFVNDRATDCHIKRIRRKLADVGAPERLLETVYGAGYRYTGVGA